VVKSTVWGEQAASPTVNGRLRVRAAGGVVLVAVAASLVSGPARAGRSPAPNAAPTTTLVPTTIPPPTSTAPSTVAAVPTGPTTTVAPLPAPENESVDPVRLLVPSITVVAEALTDEADRQTAIVTALAAPSHTVAVEAAPGTLCALVPVAAPLMAEGRWERNGQPVRTTPEQRRDPPGYGDCFTNDNGEAFSDGVYQYVAIGPTGATSGAATVVVGSEPLVAWFVNNGDEPVCLVLVSPEPADFYEANDTDSPLLPGEAIAITLADVDHDVRVFGCPPDEAVASFQIAPEPQIYVEMFDADDEPPAPTSLPPTSVAAATTTTTT